MDIKTRIKLNKQELAAILALHFDLDPEKTVFIPHFEKGDRTFDPDYWSFEVEGIQKNKQKPIGLQAFEAFEGWKNKQK